MNHVELMREHHDHTSSWCLYQMYNPPEFTWVTVPGQNLEVGQATPTRLSQVGLKGSGNMESIVIITDQKPDPSPAEVF